MAVKLSQDVKVRIEVNGDVVFFSFPPYHHEGFRKQINALLKNRYLFTGQGETRNASYEAREEFFNAACTGCTGVCLDDDGDVPLNPETPSEVLEQNGATRWFELIPQHWKAEVASYFEESSVRAKQNVEGE
jgi:hypothetical protein